MSDKDFYKKLNVIRNIETNQSIVNDYGINGETTKLKCFELIKTYIDQRYNHPTVKLVKYANAIDKWEKEEAEKNNGTAHNLLTKKQDKDFEDEAEKDKSNC